MEFIAGMLIGGGLVFAGLLMGARKTSIDTFMKDNEWREEVTFHYKPKDSESKGE